MSDIQNWSTTAASNNSASPDGWPESMAPSGINNSARENMAALRRLYGDWNGALTSGGSSNAYTLSPNRTIAAYAAGINFTFLANHANTGAATLNVSSLGAKDIRDRNGNALTGAEIASGGVVEVVYDNSNGYFRATNLVANSASSNPSASETVQGIVELATAAETLTGSSQTLAVTPYALANIGKSLSNIGYLKLPGGLKMNWGFVNLSASATTTVTHASGFSSHPYAVAVTLFESNTTAREALKVTSFDSTTLNIYNQNAQALAAWHISIGPS